jgi:uncharacterized protein (DUF924 family)
MTEDRDWRTVYDFWFPPGLDDAGAETHHHMFAWWFGGGANKELPRFAPVLDAARAGRLRHWLATPRGRLTLIVVLDQFPRSLLAGTPAAYASDPDALSVAEEGLRNGHYDALAKPWERTFFFMPLGHAEGQDHRARLERVAVMAELIALETPQHLRPLYRFSAGQARPPRGDRPLRQVPPPQPHPRASVHAGGGGLPGEGRPRAHAAAATRVRG